MSVTVGTFNLNNLFSRWNFRGEIEAIQDGDTSMGVGVSYVFDQAGTYRIRTFMGRLVRGKNAVDRQRVIERIQAIDLDVLAVQEVEDLDTLRRFAIQDLAGLYPYRVLIEGNDPRLIDVAVLSKLPIRASTSYRHAVHPNAPNEPVFRTRFARG